MIRPAVRTLALAASLLSACSDMPRSWVPVARDANYDIYLDTSSIRTHRYGTVEVWFRTDHAAPRMYDGKEFDRELVLSIVNCTQRTFKVARVDMALGDSRPVARQRSNEDELREQQWRKVGDGSAEQMAAEAACHFGRRRLASQGSLPRVEQAARVGTPSSP